MSEELKPISEILKEEFVRASKPQADWRKFVYLVVQRYELTTNSIYDWILYDFLKEYDLIPEGYNLRPNNEAKNIAMDEIICKKILTIEQIKKLFGK